MLAFSKDIAAFLHLDRPQESQQEASDLQRKLTMRPCHEFKGSGLVLVMPKSGWPVSISQMMIRLRFLSW